jgi:hypothetical protein
MRPLYENAANVSDEEAIVIELLPFLKLDAYCKLSMAYGVDFALMMGDDTLPARVVLFAEAKKRNWAFGSGDGYRLSLLKARSAWSLQQTTGIKSVLAVRFNDGIIRWCRMNTYNDRVIIAGRTDRGDPFDLEPHVTFDWVVFEELA